MPIKGLYQPGNALVPNINPSIVILRNAASSSYKLLQTKP
jgi:hypothetical protein